MFTLNLTTFSVSFVFVVILDPTTPFPFRHDDFSNAFWDDVILVPTDIGKIGQIREMSKKIGRISRTKIHVRSFIRNQSIFMEIRDREITLLVLLFCCFFIDTLRMNSKVQLNLVKADTCGAASSCPL